MHRTVTELRAEQEDKYHISLVLSYLLLLGEKEKFPPGVSLFYFILSLIFYETIVSD